VQQQLDVIQDGDALTSHVGHLFSTRRTPYAIDKTKIKTSASSYNYRLCIIQTS
jgi:hypothetical protein